MGILTGAGLGFLFLTIFFSHRTLHNAKRRRIVRAGGSCVSCLASATIAALIASLTFSYLTYTRLTSEQAIARVELINVAPFEYRARLMIDGERDQFFLLSGDEWQLDARLVTWTPPATLLGLDPIYRLDRLSGRYGDVDQERSEPRTAHALSRGSPLDIWRVARSVPWMLPGIDAQYGAATYVPMADGAVFEVSLSRNALIARPANTVAEDAVSGWR